MCEHGDTVDVLVPIPADLSHTGEDRMALKPIDRCIAPIVRALNEAGIFTRSCCCGHGKIGSIALQDGRELVLGRWDEGLEGCNHSQLEKNAHICRTCGYAVLFPEEKG